MYTGITNTKNTNYTSGGIYLLPDNYIYISHLDDNIQYWRLPAWPDVVSDSMSSTFSSTYALGRSAPVYTYGYSGPRTVQIDINLHRDLMDDANMGWSNSVLGYGEDYVDNLTHALQSITVPKYNTSNKAVEPPLVAVRLGKEVFVKGVVSAGIGLTYEKPILSNDKYARVRMSLTISEVDPYDASTVYKNGSFRGMVSTLKNMWGGYSDNVGGLAGGDSNIGSSYSGGAVVRPIHTRQ